jgi:hypothetical protein
MAEKAQTQVKAKGPEIVSSSGSSLQRKCACGTHTMGDQCDSCKGKGSMLQRKRLSNDDNPAVPPIVYEVLRSSGQPLDASTRTLFEQRFGNDFSQVRIHTDTKAAQSAQSVRALAYTVGRDVVFGAKQYEPNTELGKELLAHELSHVVQQTALAPWETNGPHSIVLGPLELEKEASHVPNVRSGHQARSSLSKTGICLQKQEEVKHPSTTGWEGGLEKLLPSFAKEKELARPIKYPTIDLGTFVVRPTLSLVGSLTYGPANSVITLSEGEFGAAMGGLAKSFSIAFVKDPGGKKIKGVTFTSNIPGIGKYDSFNHTYKPPLTMIWSSTFTPAPLAFKRLKVEGTLRVQLELAFEPKAQPFSTVPSTHLVPSMKPAVGLSLLALMMAALAIAARVGVAIAQAVTAPIILLDPDLTDPQRENHKRFES